jgi:hypothetical protein
MNTNSHLMSAVVLYNYFDRSLNVKLNKAGFLLGCILPDYDFSFLAGMHTVENFWESVQEDIRKTAERKTGTNLRHDFHYSKRLGIIFHYFMDFFCFAHSNKFDQNVRNHLRYEKALEAYYLENYDLFGRMEYPGLDGMPGTVEEAIDFVDKLNHSFQTAPQDFSREIIFSLTACAHTGSAILLHSRSLSRNNDGELCRAAV